MHHALSAIGIISPALRWLTASISCGDVFYAVATCVAAAEIKTGPDFHVVYPPMGSQLRITNIVLGAADKGAKSSADERVLLNCSANGLKYDTMIPHRTTC